MKLSDEYLFQFFDVGNNACDEPSKNWFSLAITPYESLGELNEWKRMILEYHSAVKPLDTFLLVHAARLERTDLETLA